MEGASGYVVHLSYFNSGERFPILLYQDSYQPVVLSTRYLLDECRETKQAATLLRNVRVLKWFYDWCDMAGMDLEARLRQGRLPTAAEISGFSRYLRARRTSGVVGSVGVSEQEGAAVLSPVTFNS
ncbi:MAG: hypothetical protein L0338_39815, partial [Acidobacteria bacterium]|nr:hypothetical protein [Acidobacteriota bacterium]